MAGDDDSLPRRQRSSSSSVPTNSDLSYGRRNRRRGVVGEESACRRHDIVVVDNCSSNDGCGDGIFHEDNDDTLESPILPRREWKRRRTSESTQQEWEGCHRQGATGHDRAGGGAGGDGSGGLADKSQPRGIRTPRMMKTDRPRHDVGEAVVVLEHGDNCVTGKCSPGF